MCIFDTYIALSLEFLIYVNRDHEKFSINLALDSLLGRWYRKTILVDYLYFLASVSSYEESAGGSTPLSETEKVWGVKG